MAKTILVFGEQRGGVLKKSVLELIGLGVDLADGGTVHAVLPGASVGAVAEQLSAAGAQVLATEDPSLEYASPEAYCAQIEAAIGAVSPDVVLFSATAMGRDLAPRVAARMEAGFISECLSLQADGDGFKAGKSMYGGKINATVASTPGARLVATIKPGAHAPSTAGGGSVSSLPLQSPAALRAKVTAVSTVESDRPDLQEAETIVSGGRGLKAAENFQMVEDLAKVLGAAVGASRAIVDAGWVPHHYQVGQTGTTVSPKLYIAIGISGAIQHLAGMKTSGCIVAINKDAEAPIFKLADFGLVGDAFEIVPLLKDELAKVV